MFDVVLAARSVQQVRAAQDVLEPVEFEEEVQLPREAVGRIRHRGLLGGIDESLLAGRLHSCRVVPFNEAT